MDFAEYAKLKISQNYIKMGYFENSLRYKQNVNLIYFNLIAK